MSSVNPVYDTAFQISPDPHTIYHMLILFIYPNLNAEEGFNHGVACLAALPGEIEHDDWPIPVVNVQTSSLEQAKLYAAKLVQTARTLQQGAPATISESTGAERP